MATLIEAKGQSLLFDAGRGVLQNIICRASIVTIDCDVRGAAGANQGITDFNGAGSHF